MLGSPNQTKKYLKLFYNLYVFEFLHIILQVTYKIFITIYLLSTIEPGYINFSCQIVINRDKNIIQNLKCFQNIINMKIFSGYRILSARNFSIASEIQTCTLGLKHT